MKAKITFLMFCLFCGISWVNAQFSSDRPDLRLCGSAPNYYLDYFNCTSNNYTLDDVFLSLTDVNGVPLNNTTCTPGVPETMYVMLNYTSNSNSNIYHTRMFADLIIDGVITQLNVNLGTVAPGSGQRLLYGPFTWICGQEMILDRILIVWRTNGDNDELVPYVCNSYNKAQCELPQGVVISAPLAVQFTYSGCTEGNQTTINFDSTTNGGIPPYSFAWDFDSNGTTDSTQENPTFVYNNAISNTATLTVTDSNGLSNSYVVVINYPTELQVSGQVTGLTCVDGSTGAIDLSVSGGNPPYTYSWSNGATTQDINNLAIGNYQVTVTDSIGCTKVANFSINPIVCCEFSVTCPTFQPLTLECYDLLPSATTISIADFEALGNGDGIIGNNPCGIIEITASNSAYLGCNSEVIRTYTITEYEDTNDNGIRDLGENTVLNTTTCSQTIIINDTTAPTITISANDLTVECDGSGNVAQLNAWLAANGGASASDSCSSVTWSNDFSAVAAACGATGSVTVTFTATDDCGNTESTSATFTIQDTENPYFTSVLPEDISASCDNIPRPGILEGLDNCSTTTHTFSEEIISDEESCVGNYILIRTWTLTDDCGNSVSHSQTITVYDTTPPALISNLDTEVNVRCSEIPEIPNLEFSDNCSEIAEVEFSEETTIISIYEYIIIRTWIVSDTCGNFETFTQTINVSVDEPFDAIPFSVCSIEDPIDLFTILGAQIPTNGEWVDLSNTGGLNGSMFNPINIPTGYYTLQYVVTVEDDACPMVFEIYLNVNDDCIVLPACTVEVFNAVSPNNDGLNDLFLIDGIECYPDNSVEIYNRWGILIYETRGYDNSTKAFKGYSDGRSTFNRNELVPDGTYFYILRYKDEDNKWHDRSGYLYVNR